MRFSLSCLVLLFINAVPCLGQSWVEVSRPRMTVVGPNEDAVSTIVTLTAHVDSLLDLSPHVGQTRTQLTIIAADSGTYSRFSNSTRGRLSLFVATTDQNYVLLGPRARAPEVLHEYAHYWTREHMGPSAPWFDEGFAVALSNLRAKQTTLELSGASPYDRSFFNKCHNDISLDEMLRETSFQGYDRGRLRAFYSTAGRFIGSLFLISGIPAVLSNLGPIVQGPTTVEEVARRLGKSPSTIRSSFAEYCGQPNPVGTLRTGRSASFEGHHALSETQMGEILAGLSVRIPSESANGINFYGEVLRLNPGNTSALEGIGIGYTVAGDFRNAVASFQRLQGLGGLSVAAEVYRRYACQHLVGCDSGPISSKVTTTLAIAKASHPVAENLDEDAEESTAIEEFSSRWSCKENCPKVQPR